MSEDQFRPTTTAGDPDAVAEENSVARFYPTKRVPPPMAAKADDLEALRTAVVDAAGVGATLWLSSLLSGSLRWDFLNIVFG